MVISRLFKIGCFIFEILISIQILIGILIVSVINVDLLPKILLHIIRIIIFVPENTTLITLLIIHIVGSFVSYKYKRVKRGHILGIFACILSFIPVVGIILHIFSAFSLISEAINNKTIRTDADISNY